MPSHHIDQVYNTSSDPADQERLYDDWAEAYDADLASMNFLTHVRMAEHLAAVTDDLSAPVYDYGCGTGLLGTELANVGFTTIDGGDLSAGMLKVADHKDVYRRLDKTEPGVFDIEPYPTVTACGVVTVGAAPPETLGLIASGVAPGGRLALSYNDEALAHPGYMEHMQRLLDDGFTTLVEDYGPQFPDRGIGATVYILERTP